jgi:hypothetical protein
LGAKAQGRGQTVKGREIIWGQKSIRDGPSTEGSSSVASEETLGEDSNGMGGWFPGFWAPAGSTASAWAASDDGSGGFRVSKRMLDTGGPGMSGNFWGQKRFI